MKLSFYIHLAKKNIKSNAESYAPYIFASSFSLMMYSIIRSLWVFTKLDGRVFLETMLSFGTFVVAIFSFIFIFYGNKFLIKRRVKEIGLYNILGLGKQHIAGILFFEFLFCLLVSFIIGNAFALLFGKLIFLILNKVSIAEQTMNYSFQLSVLWNSGLLFLGIFFLNYIYNLAKISFLNPIQLLKESSAGQKKNKASIVTTLIGLCLIVGGYYLASTAKDPMHALNLFFPAVILVIIATYFLFGSILSYILNKLKQKQSYYKPARFIFVSGMMYRMGQHAKGLASICVLLTMVFITVASTFSIHNADKESVERIFSRQYMLEFKQTKKASEQNFDIAEYSDEKNIEANLNTITEKIKAVSAKHNITATDFLHVKFLFGFAKVENNICTQDPKMTFAGINRPAIITLTTVSQIENFIGNKKTIPLKNDEIILVSDSVKIDYTKPFEIAGNSFNIKKADKQVYEVVKNSTYTNNIPVKQICLVFADSVPIKKIQTVFNNFSQQIMTANAINLTLDEFNYIHWNAIPNTNESKDLKTQHIEKNISAMYEDELNKLAITDFVPTADNKQYAFKYSSKYKTKIERKEFSGSFLFLGVFLSVLFLLWLVLIMYFKQISEGYEDRHLYSIMRKIGIDSQLIKKTSRAQLIWMFILPVGISVIHCIFGAPLFTKLLSAFGVFKQGAFLSALVITIVAVSIQYYLFYLITANQYSKIIRK